MQGKNEKTAGGRGNAGEAESGSGMGTGRITRQRGARDKMQGLWCEFGPPDRIDRFVCLLPQGRGYPVRDVGVGVAARFDRVGMRIIQDEYGDVR